MKQSLIVLLLTFMVVGCSTTPEVTPVETKPKSATPVEIREAAWSCQNSDMTGFHVTTPDFTVQVTCS